MKDLFKYGLIAAGLAYLFKDQITDLLTANNPSMPSTEPSTGGSATPDPSPTPAPGGSNSQASAPSLLDQVIARAGGGKWTFDQWNWFLMQTAGIQGPAPENVGHPRVEQMPALSAQEWAAFVAKAGIDLGAAAPTQNTSQASSSTSSTSRTARTSPGRGSSRSI